MLSTRLFAPLVWPFVPLTAGISAGMMRSIAIGWQCAARTVLCLHFVGNGNAVSV